MYHQLIKPYNEMRIRCTTKYLIQNDEDMEIYNNAIDIFYDSILKIIIFY